MTSLKSIAKKARVSIRTVSRALNDLPDISPATKFRIQRIADKEGYRPHFAARSLRTHKTGIIGLIRSGTGVEIENRRIQKITEILHQQGYCLLQGLLNAPEETNALFDKFENICDGLIILHIDDNPVFEDRLKDLKKNHRAFILVDPLPNLSSLYPSVILNRESGIADGIASLDSSGKRSIAFLTPSPDHPNRLQGFKDGLARLGIPFTLDRIITAPKPANSSLSAAMESGYRAVQTRPEIGRSIDALFCFDDKTALGALRALHERGIQVPEQVALIGFDDDSYAAFTHVPLSTVSQPVEEPAESAVRLLFNRMVGTRTESVEFKTTFIKRQTT